MGNRIRDNVVEGCFTLIDLTDSSVHTIAGNELRGGFGGIVLTGRNEGHRIRDNEAIDVFGFADASAFFLGDEARGNRFDDNRVEGGAYGFTLSGPLVEGNLVAYNEVTDAYRSAFVVTDAVGNVLKHNDARESGDAGFVLDGAAARNLLDDNEADDNDAQGFLVTETVSGNVLEDNEACDNEGPDAQLDPTATGIRWFDNDFCTESGL